jgi:hypothetical protein
MIKILKVIYLAVIGIGFAFACIGIRNYGWHPFWDALHVPVSLEPMGWFEDLHCIAMAYQTSVSGLDPYQAIQHYPVAFNYPRLWLYIARQTDLPSHYPYIATGEAVGFLACIGWMVAEAKTKTEATLVALSAFSSAALTLMAQGNIDTIIFMCVFIAVRCRSGFGYAAAMLAGIILKLFPVFGLGGGLLFRSHRWPSVLGLLAGGVYFAATAGDVSMILSNTPAHFHFAFGAKSIEALALDLGLLSGAPGIVLGIILFMIMPSIFVLAGFQCKQALRRATPATPATLTEEEQLRFATFAMIYIGVFLLGSNWYYRLVFTIPLIPALCSLLQTPFRKQAILGLGSLCAALHLPAFIGSQWQHLQPIDGLYDVPEAIATLGLCVVLTDLCTTIVKHRLNFRGRLA